MPNVNIVILAGHLTRDPELKYTPSETAVCSFGLAINHGWKGKDGEDKTEVCFIDVVMFGKRAETLNKYFKKGGAILVQGRLKLDQWEKDGRKQSKISVIADSFQFVGDSGKKEELF